MRVARFGLLALLTLVAFSLLPPFAQGNPCPASQIVVNNHLLENSQSIPDIHWSTGYALSNPLRLTANYSYAIDASGTSFQISIHTVQSFAYCNVSNTMIFVKPEIPFTYSTSTDDLGNDVLTIKFQSMSYLGKFYLTVLQHVTTYSIKYSIDPANIGSYDKASQLYMLYTRAAQYVESDHPEIATATKAIVGNETNPYVMAKRIFDYLVENVRRDWSLATYNPETEGALFTLRTGRGVCRHFSALFVALARAAGIPAAMIWGSWNYGLVDKHDWAHFYLPNYGWIPVETTFGDSKQNAGRWFAELPDNIHIPVMSVNYGYRRAWWSGGTVRSLVPIEEPFISAGFEIPELSNPYMTLLVTVAICLTVTKKRLGRHGQAKSV